MAKTPEEKAAAKAAKDAAATTNPGPEGAVADAPTPTVPAKPSKTEVTVKYRDHQGVPTERTFSKDVHGEEFAALADEFKATNASRIVA